MNSKTNKAPGIFFTYEYINLKTNKVLRIFLTHEYIIILRDYLNLLVNPSSTQAYFKSYKESKKYLYLYKKDISNTRIIILLVFSLYKYKYFLDSL